MASFDGSNGDQPFANLTINSAGDLHGTANMGAGGFGCSRWQDYQDGVVFEIAKTADTPAGSGYGNIQVLASFTGTGAVGASNPDPGAGPLAGLIANSSDDLFGTTPYGGLYGYGEAFELTSGGTFNVLASFGDANGDSTGPGLNPYGGLVTDKAGDLFGTTANGGQNGDGTIYEVPKTSTGFGTLEILASFDNANGAGPQAGLTIDAAGNLYGTTDGAATTVMALFSNRYGPEQRDRLRQRADSHWLLRWLQQ